ncbi:phBC6A51 family helix-turn-helix protein [Rossellomorea marisflavi]
MKPFIEDPQLTDIHEGLEEFESVPLDSPGFNLNHRDRLICLLYTTRDVSGMTAQDIADQMEISRQRLYAIVGKQEAKRYMSHLNDLMFAELWEDSVREMRNILKKSHSETNKIKIIEMVMKSKNMFKEGIDIHVSHDIPSEYDYERKRKEIIDMQIDEIE